MASQVYFNILKQGVEAWNQWRQQNPEIIPDLSGVDIKKEIFIGGNFSRVNFREATLYRANFTSADFQGADLCNANLFEAHLSRTDLREANLLRADLHGAHLVAANLTGAILRETDLRETNLTGANFESLVLFETIFGNTCLKNAKNLEFCIHKGPSTIDFRTIAKSGNLPLAFLRGCGLPDSVIDYLPSLLNKEPIQFYSCFISYSHKDEEFAKRLHADLQNNGIRCWFAPEDIRIGDKIRFTVDQSIRVYDKLLLILSEYSTQSNWVEHEVEAALDKEAEQGQIVLFPIKLDNSVMSNTVGWAAKIRRERHIGDFREWKNHDSYQKSFERLLRDLKTKNDELLHAS